MSFREVIETVLARWYVAAVALLLTLAMGWKVDHPARVFQATTVLLLVPPQAPSSPNTLAAVTPSIAATGLMVDTILSDGTSADRLRKAGVTNDYSLTPRNNGTVQTPKYSVPAEQLSVTGPDPDAVLTSVTKLSAVFVAELDDMQARADVPVSIRITAQELVPPAVVQVHGSKLRGLAGVAILGTIAIVVLPNWYDRYMGRRIRRARRAAANGTGKRRKANTDRADRSEKVPV
ncbi:hypothetical protein [Actinocrinis sp.]|uniref:hypothetical protein n=1 Tax=Actinocrinis sp. TaxID=1920516 RepID=UPI002C17DBD9|nr:hypothetical protein [Actinocrinis sp.]HXR72681.1 hypothetical protein [Actinocrinis sp.]